MSNKIITYKYGFLFPLMILIFGFFFIGVSFQGIPSHKTFAKAFMMSIGFGIVLARHGLQIDASARKYRDYISFLGLKMSKWKDYSSFTDISIIYEKRNVRIAGKSNLSFADVDEYYRVVLLTPNHLRKLELFRTDKVEVAKEKLHELAISMEVNSVRYAPKNSEQTLANRRI